MLLLEKVGPVGVCVWVEGLGDLDGLSCSGEVFGRVASGLCLVLQFCVVLFFIRWLC